MIAGEQVSQEAPPVVAAQGSQDMPQGVPQDASASVLAIPKDYVPTAESVDALYHLDVDGYQGPLDLLLLLIRRHKIDIFDIPIARVCGHYLDEIHKMEALNIDVAAGFLSLASELMYIKSRLLLPKTDDEEDEEDEGDPRADLVRRLLEHQKYRAAGEEIDRLNRLGRDVFGRDSEDVPMLAEGELRAPRILSLAKALNRLLKSQKPEFVHRVMLEQVSVRHRMLTLVDSLVGKASLAFETLLDDGMLRGEVVGNFFAILEMTRMGLLKVYASPDAVLYLYPRFATAQEAHEVVARMGRELPDENTEGPTVLDTDASIPHAAPTEDHLDDAALHDLVRGGN